MARKIDRILPLDADAVREPDCPVRRRLLAGISGLLATGLPGLSMADRLTFAEFLVAANATAVDLVDDVSTSGQDRYLRSLASLAALLDGVPMPERFNDSNQGDTPDAYRIGVNPGGDPFTVLHWRMEPGARCRPHAHTYGNVVTVGLEGMVRVKNYQVDGVPDYAFGGTFRVIETVDQLLGPGEVNLVSLDRNYIHGLVAGPDGARGIDITTRLEPRPDHGTPFLDIADAPLDAFLRTYEASWIYYD